MLPPHGGLGLAVSAAVTAGVVVLAVALLGHGSRPNNPALTHRHFDRGVAPGEILYPSGAVATKAQLLANFAVLRRSQTSADRTWRPQCDCAGAAHQLFGYTRLATTLPSGYKVYLDLEQFILGGQLNMAAGSYVLNFDVVDPHGPTSGAAFGPNTGFTVFPISSGGDDAAWVSVVPDGVATVRWTFGCERGAGCAGVPTRVFTVPVVNNVAARQIPGAGNGPPHAVSRHVTWRDAGGRTIASFTQSANLPAPPFIKGGRGYRVLRILRPDGVGDARIGQSVDVARAALTRELGPAADTAVRARGCGVDHESVWASPAVADPLTLFEHAGRVVGYAYGAPASEIGLQRGPGAVLTTAAGLTIAERIKRVAALYGTALSTEAAHGGTWQVRLGSGRLGGTVMPTTYPLRKVTPANPVATIGAGHAGCPAPTP
jgi:hypothetical protein